MALENALLLVVYFQTRHRKRLLYSFIYPCSLVEHMGREGGVVSINSKWLSICLHTVKSIRSLFLFPFRSRSCSSVDEPWLVTAFTKSSPSPPPPLWYLCTWLLTHQSTTRYSGPFVCCCVFFVYKGNLQPARPNEALLHCAVQRAEVALQHTHELLKAICGRWHSLFFPQTRRHQQMVGVKMLNNTLPFYSFFFFFPRLPLF